jgi:hypothetical protein
VIDEYTWRRNLATYKHEAETPMRGHDEDGACCRKALLRAAEPADPLTAPWTLSMDPVDSGLPDGVLLARWGDDYRRWVVDLTTPIYDSVVRP